MDVSQFLKSFKKNVAAKAKQRSAIDPTATSADVDESAELSDLLHSDSDQEGEAPSGDYVVGGRADRLNERRYGAHQKRNQNFEALTVLGTNATAARQPSRTLRHRAVTALQPADVRQRPQAEMVAAVRADLLRQRAQLQRADAYTTAAAEAAPAAQVAETMVHIDDLLATPTDTATSSNHHNSIQGDRADDVTADLLDFLPPTTTTAPTGKDTVTASSPAMAQAPPTTANTPTLAEASAVTEVQAHSPSSLPAASTLPKSEEEDKTPPQPPKKRSKFEMAMAMAKADDDDEN